MLSCLIKVAFCSTTEEAPLDFEETYSGKRRRSTSKHGPLDPINFWVKMQFLVPAITFGFGPLLKQTQRETLHFSRTDE